MEYHWTPEAFLATGYPYLNPSTDARGRLVQSGEMQLDEKNYRGRGEDVPRHLEGRSDERRRLGRRRLRATRA